MPLETLWQRYADGGYAAVRDATPADADGCFYLALLAFAEGEPGCAARWATAAAERRPQSRVYTQAAAYLARVVEAGTARVYGDGTAFAAFIRGGGNVGLYAAVSAALRAIYDEYESLRLLDIGVGDGLALLPALTPAVTGLDLVEPSAAMLLPRAPPWKHGIVHRPHPLTLGEFIRTDGQRGQWDVIQATWACNPSGRAPGIFRGCGRTARVLIAEFDAWQFAAPLSLGASLFRRALRARPGEYDGDGGWSPGLPVAGVFGALTDGGAPTGKADQGWSDDLRRRLR